MESFTVMLEIYNWSMVLLITPIVSPLFCFHIRTIAHGPNAMTMSRLPDLSWTAEDIHMKYFTMENIQRLGAQIELEKPSLFLQENTSITSLYKGQNALLNIRLR